MFDNKYPYTDFSQLNLDWFLLKFKELLEEQERVSGKVKDLDDTVKEFTDFVTNYFDNLDVQAEVNVKLNEMAADGTLSDLLAPLVSADIGDVVAAQIGDVVDNQIDNVVADQIGAVVADQIDAAVAPEVPGAVTDWLNDNVDPVGSAVVVDGSLSVSGAAADAKVVGYELNNIIDIIGNEIIRYLKGYFRITNGASIDITGSGLNSNASYATALVSCSEGDVFTVSGYGGVSTGVWAFVKADGEVITRHTSGSLQVITDLVLTAPANAAYLVLNCYEYTTHKYLSYKNISVDVRIKTSQTDIFENTSDIDSFVDQFNSIEGSKYVADKSDDNPDSTLSGKVITIYGLSDIAVPAYEVKVYSIQNPGVYYLDAFADYDNCFYQALDANDNILFTKTKVSSGATIEEFHNYITVHDTWKKIRISQSKSSGAYFGKGLLIPGKWSGLKWTVMGDSLTEQNDKASIHYYDYISADTGIDVYIRGVSGSGYKRRDGNNDAFYQRVDTIPTDSDVVTIFGSGNDCSTQLTYGTYTDTTTDTVAGCVNTTITRIIDRFLTAGKLPIIGIITPTPWMGNMPEDGSGQIMEEYVNLLVDICKYRCVPCLDLYHSACMFPNNSTYRQLAYSNDGGAGTHPDNAGQKVFAPRIKWFLESLLIK